MVIAAHAIIYAKAARKYCMKKYLSVAIALVCIMIGAYISYALISGTALNRDAVAVWVFDVGQGDAMFIDTHNQDVLIDGGPGSDIEEKLTAVLAPWDRHIEWMVNTHAHADHVTGLVHVLEIFTVDSVLANAMQYPTDIFQTFLRLVDERPAVQGDTYMLDEDVTMTVLWPTPDVLNELENPNDASIVLLLEYADHSVLLTGDIGIEQEHAIMPFLHHVDVLKVGHQGSRTSSDWEFLQTIQPDVAIISVGENSYGHPHAEIVSRLEQIGAAVLRTDQDGDVRILLEPEGISIKTFDL